MKYLAFSPPGNSIQKQITLIFMKKIKSMIFMMNNPHKNILMIKNYITNPFEGILIKTMRFKVTISAA